MTLPASARRLSAAVQGIDGFLFQPRSRTPLRFMRIAFGLFLVGYFTGLHPLAMMLYGTDGLVSRGGEFPLSRIVRPQLFHLLSDHSDRVVWLVTGGGIASGLWLASGFFSRLAPCVVWLFVSSVVTVIPGNSGDLLVMSFATYLAVAGLAGHLVVGGKTPRNHPPATADGGGPGATLETATETPGLPEVPAAGKACRGLPAVLSIAGGQAVPAWSIRLFQVQLVLVYFFSGYHKLANDAWYRGTALHYIAGQTFWSRYDLSHLDDWPVITSALTTAVLLFELVAFPVLVWVRPWRIPILLAGVVFHVAIYVTMRVFTFHQIMMLYYLAFLLPEDWQAIAGLCEPLRKLLARHR